MPRVPTVDQNEVGLAEPTQARFQAADNGGGVTGAIAQGMQQLGQAGDRLAQAQAEVAERHAITAAKEADNQFASRSATILTDPDTGYLSQRGQKAVDGHDDAIAALSSAKNEIMSGLKTPLAMRKFGEVADARIATMTEGINRHVAQQSRVYEDDVSDSRIETNRSDAILLADDPQAAAQSIATAQGELIAKLMRAGASKDSIDQQVFALGSQTRLGMVKRLADGNTAGAQSLYDASKGLLTGQDATAAENTIRIATARDQAEQRRAAAEARAEQAHQVAAAKEQLGTASVQLANGAGTSADWFRVEQGYTQIGDAKQAAEAHAKGVEMSAAEHFRGATLPQMDARLGELNGKASLGTDEASERKGLMALRDQTATRLNQPGGALAQLQFATGATVQPLNLNDPHSYSARAAQAVTAASTFGRQVVEPLTQPEARPLKDMVASGKSDQRLGALMQISKFTDPRAIDGAARQVAGPGDGAFRVAASLSTLPGDFGHQTARDMLRGAEAAATNGAAYLPKEAAVSFTTYAAPALKGMSPDYAADVQSAARDLYFERMRQAGKTAWDENEWHSAVDAALGSYTQNGIKYGGVTSYRGAQVSIPPGWTGSGVFGRIARASAAEWSAASTAGAPRWPDGSAVYSGQLRDLTPVRLGGTTYGLMTSSGKFLGTKRGTPYQVDLAKLPWHP